MNELAQAIREARGLMTQAQFASAIGVKRQAVIEWEKARQVPQLRHAARLIDAGVPRAALLDAAKAVGGRNQAA